MPFAADFERAEAMCETQERRGLIPAARTRDIAALATSTERST
jgi:hypothetical protein